MIKGKVMDLFDEALQRISELLERAEASGLREPTAMSVATVDEQGHPSVRTLLLKKADREGFVFFTNTTSRKGQQLAANPYAAICFYWQGPHEQVQAEGPVEQISDDEADAYWLTRDRSSQLGAWASMQSQQLPDRQTLIDRVKKYEEKFAGQDVPRPDFWSGYRLKPTMIEFWHGDPNRLNQRLRYECVDGEWSKCEVYP